MAAEHLLSIWRECKSGGGERGERRERLLSDPSDEQLSIFLFNTFLLIIVICYSTFFLTC